MYPFLLQLRNSVLYDSVRFFATALDFHFRERDGGVLLDRLSCQPGRGEWRKWRTGPRIANILRDVRINFVICLLLTWIKIHLAVKENGVQRTDWLGFPRL